MECTNAISTMLLVTVERVWAAPGPRWHGRGHSKGTDFIKPRLPMRNRCNSALFLRKYGVQLGNSAHASPCLDL